MSPHWGMTCLHIGIQENWPEVVRVALGHGFSMEQVDISGRTSWDLILVIHSLSPPLPAISSSFPPNGVAGHPSPPVVVRPEPKQTAPGIEMTDSPQQKKPRMEKERSSQFSNEVRLFGFPLFPFSLFRFFDEGDGSDE